MGSCVLLWVVVGCCCVGCCVGCVGCCVGYCVSQNTQNTQTHKTHQTQNTQNTPGTDHQRVFWISNTSETLALATRLRGWHPSVRLPMGALMDLEGLHGIHFSAFGSTDWNTGGRPHSPRSSVFVAVTPPHVEECRRSKWVLEVLILGGSGTCS